MATRTIYARGVATLELLIAFALATTLLTGALLVSFSGQSATLDVILTGEGMPRAYAYQKQAVEDVFSDWDTGAGIASSDDGYTKNRTFVDISQCIKLVGSNTTWTSEAHRGQYLDYGTLVGNIANAKAMGGSCSPFPPEEWDTPTSLGTVSSSDVDGAATGIGMASIGGTRYVFITTENGAGSPKDDLWVFDTTDPAPDNPPVLLASIDVADSLNDIAVARDPDDGKWYAYVAGFTVDTGGTCPGPGNNKPTINQLQVIELTNPLNPNEIASTPNLVASESLSEVEACGSYPAGYSIYYYDEKVYVGTKETGGDEFTIFDVSTPADPNPLGSINVIRNVNDIIVKDGLAYLATGSGESGANNPFRIYDVDPDSSTFLQLVGSFTSTETDDQEGTQVYLLSDKIYLGLDRAVDEDDNDFFILDVNDPSDPKKANANSAANLDLQATGAFVSSLIVQGPYAFIGITKTNPQENGIQVWDISIPDSLERVNVCTDGDPLPSDASGFAYSENLLFGSFNKNEPFRILHDDPDLTCDE